MNDFERHLTQELRARADAITTEPRGLSAQHFGRGRGATASLTFLVLACLVAGLIAIGLRRTGTNPDPVTSVGTTTVPSSTRSSDPTTNTTRLGPETTLGDATESSESTSLYLSTRIAARHSPTELYVVPLHQEVGSSWTVEHRRDDGWVTVAEQIGPDMLHLRGAIVPISLPALEVGTYRLTLGGLASAEFSVCDCTPIPAPPVGPISLHVSPTVVDAGTSRVSIASSSSTAMTPTEVALEAWDGSQWSGLTGLTVTINGDVALPAIEAGTYRLVDQSDMRRIGVFFVA